MDIGVIQLRGPRSVKFPCDRSFWLLLEARVYNEHPPWHECSLGIP